MNMYGDVELTPVSIYEKDSAWICMEPSVLFINFFHSYDSQKVQEIINKEKKYVSLGVI